MSNAGPKLMMAAAGSGGASLVEVDNSALFDEDNAQYLYRDNTSAQTDTKKFTYSTWINRGAITGGTSCALLSGGSGTTSGRTDFVFTAGSSTGDGSNNDALKFDIYTGSWTQRRTLAKLRDASGWYHIVLVYDAANGTANDTLIIYLNGNRLDLDSAAGVPNNLSLINANGQRTRIGADASNTPVEFDGYMAETVMIDGQALTPSSFGEASTDGLYWTPKSSDDIKALTFGTNGFYLDNVTNAETDASGNGNNFTNNNSVVLSSHSPTNSYATLNPLVMWDDGTYSNGNLSYTFASPGYLRAPLSTLPIPATGQWYAEWSFGTESSADIGPAIDDGLTAQGLGSLTSNTSTSDTNYIAYRNNGQKRIEATSSSYGSTFVAGDVIGVAVDMDAETPTVTFYKNNTTQGAINLVTSDIPMYFSMYGSTVSEVATYNFGASDFTYTPPAGHVALNTTNIAAATTRTVSDPYEHWNNVLYTGNGTAIGSGGNAITGAGFAPDFGWLKGRSGATEHVLTDIVRGVTKELSSNDTGAEETVAEGLTAFGSDGFTVGSDGSYNTSSATYVAWLAKLGGTAASNTDGSITSSVSVNTTLGMSVGTYTGTGTSSQTIGTGLTGAVFVIFKKTSGTGDWHVGFIADGAIKGSELNNTTGSVTAAVTAFNSDTIGISSGGANNDSGAVYSFIAFAPSEFISIGSYEGNGNANGTFMPTLNSVGVPLMPIWTLIKNIDFADSWQLLDGARKTYNVTDTILLPNAQAAETTGGGRKLDYVNGGIKQRGSDTAMNSAHTFIHLTIGIPTISVDGALLAAR